MRRPTGTPFLGRLKRLGKRAKNAPSRCAGVVAMACTHGRRRQHGKPHSVVGRDDQPKAGDGQRGRYGVAERPVLLRKLGNAGGGKGPQFKTGAESSEAREIGVTLGNSCNVRQLRKAPHAEAKRELGFRSGERMLAQGATLAVVCNSSGRCPPGQHGPVRWAGGLQLTFRVRRHASCPRAGCGNSACPVR
jgi:hypothetical protein